MQAIGNPQMAAELARRGLGRSQIAAVLGVAVPCVALYLSEEYQGRRPNRSVRSDAGDTKQRCELCGRPRPTNTQRCALCAAPYRTGMRVGRSEERVRLLRKWAEANGGRIPKIPEAVDILMVNRSCAAQAMLDAFGRDPRNGATRHKTRRKLRVS